MFSTKTLIIVTSISLLNSMVLAEYDTAPTPPPPTPHTTTNVPPTCTTNATMPSGFVNLNSSREVIKDTTNAVQVNGAKEQISEFRRALMGYEKRVKIFIDNFRRGYLSMYTDERRFLEELSTYLEMLPKNDTKVVTKPYRSTCYCDDRRVSPCPDRCINSCYGTDHHGRTEHRDDCTLFSRPYSDCYCYQGSSTSCDSGIDNCYTERTEIIQDDKPCQEFAVNKSMIEKSFSSFSTLLLEPLKIRVRDLEFQIYSLKEAVITTDLLSNLTEQLCQWQELACLPEATELLQQKLQFHKQRRRNITLEMIKTQEEAETVSKNIHVLKEQLFAQITQSIQKYTCCLTSFNFTVDGHDCNPKPVEIATTTMRTTLFPLLHNQRRDRLCGAPNFLCENRKCILGSYQCDGNDDCGDMSDEQNCENIEKEDCHPVLGCFPY